MHCQRSYFVELYDSHSMASIIPWGFGNQFVQNLSVVAKIVYGEQCLLSDVAHF